MHQLGTNNLSVISGCLGIVISFLTKHINKKYLIIKYKSNQTYRPVYILTISIPPYYLKPCRFNSFLSCLQNFLASVLRFLAKKVIIETLWHLSLPLMAETSCQEWWESMTCICLATVWRSHPLACTLSLDRDKTALKDSKGEEQSCQRAFHGNAFLSRLPFTHAEIDGWLQALYVAVVMRRSLGESRGPPHCFILVYLLYVYKSNENVLSI